MTTSTRTRQATGNGFLRRWRRSAWVLLVVADVGLGLWGLGAALIPHNLLGTGGKAILPAGFEGYSRHSWDQLTATTPSIAGYITLIFRMYGIYIVAFSVLAVMIAANAFRRGERWAWWALLIGNTLAYPSAMIYDRIVGAIGPFEMSEYLGIGLIYATLAVAYPRTGRTAQTVAPAAVSGRPAVKT
jgi:hypothetical protein